MKKFLHIWISMFLTMLFVASLCTSVYADVDMTLTLEKVGEIQEAKLDYKSIKVYPAGLITEDTEGNYYVLDEMGNNNLGRSYGKVECFSAELFLVYDAETWSQQNPLIRNTHFSIRIPAGSPGRKNSQNTMMDMIIIMI